MTPLLILAQGREARHGGIAARRFAAGSVRDWFDAARWQGQAGWQPLS